MTNINDGQQALVDAVAKRHAALTPVLDQLQLDYESAVHQAKKTLQDEIDMAAAAGVPYRRMTEAMGFKYPQKLKAWLRPGDALVDHLAQGNGIPEPSEVFAEDLNQIEAVIRDNQTGAFNVVYRGEDYKVRAFGPDTEPWATREEGVPQEVYDLITKEYPGFEILEEDD